MATLALSNIFETQRKERARPRSAEEIAIASWSIRQMRLAQSVVDILGYGYADDFQWNAYDNFFGTPVDSAVVIGTSPNGDGTTSGIICAGDMEFFTQLLQRMPRPKSFREQFCEQIHWLDPFWGPLPLPYYLTQSFEEIDMPLNQQDINSIATAVATAVVAAIHDAPRETSVSRGDVLVARATWAAVFVAFLGVAGAFWSVWHNDTADQFKELKQTIKDGQVQNDTHFEKLAARFDALNSNLGDLSSNQHAILQRLEDARLHVRQTK